MTTTVNLSMTASATGVPGVATGSLTETRTNTATDVASWTQEIGYAADEALAIPADVTTGSTAPGNLVIKNLDSTNFVTLSYDTGGSFAGAAFATIRAGGVLCLQPVSDTIYIQADTAAVTVHAFAVEE